MVVTTFFPRLPYLFFADQYFLFCQFQSGKAALFPQVQFFHISTTRKYLMQKFVCVFQEKWECSMCKISFLLKGQFPDLLVPPICALRSGRLAGSGATFHGKLVFPGVLHVFHGSPGALLSCPANHGIVKFPFY